MPEPHRRENASTAVRSRVVERGFGRSRRNLSSLKREGRASVIKVRRPGEKKKTRP